MGFFEYLLMLTLMFVGLVLMFIVLLQRGRGGGLAGAFGGQGGQSAFGTKAGDVFTKITVGIAVVWVLLAGFSGIVIRNSAGKGRGDFGGDRAAGTPAVTPAEPSTDKGGASGAGTKSGTEAAPKSETTPKTESTPKTEPPAKTETPPAKSESPAPKTEAPAKSEPKSGDEGAAKTDGAAKPDGAGDAGSAKSEK